MTDAPLERTQTAVTQDDLFRLDAEDLHVEVVDGELLIAEENVPAIHILIIRMLFKLLDPMVTEKGLGIVLPDGARYILRGTPEKIELARRPDLSFIRADQLEQIHPDLDFYGAPALVVEVISPGQTVKSIVRRFSDYFEAGTEEAWLIQPKHRVLHQYRADADDVKTYGMDDPVESPLFPDWSFTLAEVMALPKAK